MDVTIERQGGVLTIALGGRLDVAAAAALAETLEDTIVRSDRAVILDFAEIHSIGSAGLGVVLSTAAHLEKRDAKLVLCRPSEPVRRVLRVSGVGQFLTIHETRAGALASAAG